MAVKSVEERWAEETGGVSDPVAVPQAGEVIPPGQQQQQQEAQEAGGDVLLAMLSNEVVGALFSLPGAVAQRITGEDLWQLEPEERSLLGETIGPVLRYQLSQWMTETTSPWVVAGAALGVVYGPKAFQQWQIQKERKSNPQRAQTPHPNSTEASARSSESENAARAGNSSDSSGTLID